MAWILAASSNLGRVGRMTLATDVPVPVSSRDFQAMLGFARNIDALQYNPEYIAALQDKLPQAVKIEPKYPPMLMGYDFHLTEEGPKLIEINNNAGGLWEKDDGWIPQPDIPELEGRLEQRLLRMFDAAWRHIVIMDEDIKNQYMLPEMQAYAELLRQDGRKVALLSPEDIDAQHDGLYESGARVDMIYNRHTDFYLETKPMQHIRKAYMQSQVALNPYPRSYALIGDKNRMVDWWREGFLSFLPQDTRQMIQRIVPQTLVLAEVDEAWAWQQRKGWVFKPAARHGGKGVLLGKSMSRKRFDALDKASTVMQALVPASQIELDGQKFKFDMRLYMHGDKLIALAGRAWRGQITNFQDSGSGWTPISIVEYAA